MDVGYGAIVDAIKDFQLVCNKFKNSKTDMIERIISQMLQSEKDNRQMVLRSQLQIATIFVEVLKPKKGGLSNW